MPAKAVVIASTKKATRHAPINPARTPPAIHCPRCWTALVAAITMPTTSPASMTSRKTMTSAATMLQPLFYDQHAVAGVLVKIIEELVAAGGKRTDIDAGLAIARHE